MQVTVRIELGPKPAKDDSLDLEGQCKAVSVAVDGGAVSDTVAKPEATEEAEAGVKETYNSVPATETLPAEEEKEVAEEETKEEKKTKD